MLKLRFLALSLLISGLFTFSHACYAGAAAAPAPAAVFMQNMADTAMHYLNADNISEKEKTEHLRALLRDGFDIKTIGRFVLGKHWREASDDQRREYFTLFENMVLQSYQNRLTVDKVKSFTITKVMPGESGSQDSLVSSVIVRQSDPEPTNVTWRVRMEEGRMKIVDVLVNGISSSITQRSDFDSVIMSGGGKFDALLATMRNFTSATQ